MLQPEPMFSRKLSLLFLLFLTCFVAKADTFTVTSNADSGPGTLRQALLDAAATVLNRNYIYFNLPNQTEEGRTITLQSQLPNLSANLIIDASSQPGSKFGASDAKIKIVVAPGVNVSAILKGEDVDMIEIYSLNLIANWQVGNAVKTVGIYLNRSTGVQLGNPGKGNIYNGCFKAIELNDVKSLGIKCSIFGLKVDGFSLFINQNAVDATSCFYMDIGGNAEGRNVFCDYGQNEIILNRCVSAGSTYCFFGTDITGNAIVGPSVIGNPSTATAVICKQGAFIGFYNNVFANMGTAIHIINQIDNFGIYYNNFGTDFIRHIAYGNKQAILIEQSTGKGVIGYNTLAFNEKPITIVRSNAVKITENSIYCNASKAIDIRNSLSAVPTISVASTSANFIYGTASPNTIVELFYTDECNLCQGKSFIAATSGANGQWSYSGNISGTVVATATTLDGSTSEFSGPQIIEDNAVVKNSTCSQNNGSITGIEFFNATSITWLNEQGQPVGTTKDLLNVGPGKYKLMIDNGTCSSLSRIYEIKDDRPAIVASNLKTTDATCGLANGGITGIEITGTTTYTANWRNQNNMDFGNSVNVSNLPGGQYTLAVKDANSNCPVTYGPITITAYAPLTINQSNVVITKSGCGQSTGAIKGLTVNGGSSTQRFSWKNQRNDEVATTKDLINQPPGIYTLTATDDTPCGNISTQSWTIEENIVSMVDNGIVTQPDCNGTTGAIKGITVIGATSYEWTRQDVPGSISTATSELLNVQKGTYKLVASNSDGCSQTSKNYTINPPINNENYGSVSQQVINASCGLNNGKISIIFNDALPRPAGLRWQKKGTNVLVGSGTSVSGLDAGEYDVIAIASSGCENTIGTYTITRIPALTVNTVPAQIINDNCGLSQGSITNISITGGVAPLLYSWKNAAGIEVATVRNVTGLSAGSYTLTVKDNSQCDAIITQAITITEPGRITLNDNGQITQPDCNGTTGGVDGITAPGATIFRWINTANNQTVGNALNISGLSPGSYKLGASNANGCSQTSKVYVINSPTNDEVYGGITKVLVNATCGLNNGSITATFQDASAQRPKSVRWVNQTTGQTVGTGMAIANLDAGNYGLYATGQNGCEKLIITYPIVRTTAFTVNMGAVLKRDEECGLRNGSITGITVSAANVTFTWTDKSTGQVVGSAANLSGMPAGTYVLTVTDGQCPQTLPEFVINNADTAVPMPAVADMQLCSSGDALITVISASNTISGYSYRLYEDATSTVPLITESTGKFKVNVVSPRSYFISQFKGNCESARAEVKISVGLSAINIANTFTPNGDGINDFWKINSIENYPNALVQLFNRNGTKVFESRGYVRRFDGSYQGQPLPTGAYYYIINLNTGCNLLSGSLTLVR